MNETPTVVWHVAGMNHWKDIARQQLQMLSGCGLAARPIHATFVGPESELPWLHVEAGRHDITLRIVRSDPNLLHYETFAMLHIEHLVQQSDAPILYFHTKGASAHGHHGKQHWRRLMERELISQWSAHLPQLEKVEMVGVNWREGGFPHFCGNFWLARADYLRRLPPFPQYHALHERRRTSCEFWPGAAASKVLSLYCRNQDFCDRRWFGRPAAGAFPA